MQRVQSVGGAAEVWRYGGRVRSWLFAITTTSRETPEWRQARMDQCVPTAKVFTDHFVRRLDMTWRNRIA